MPASLSRRLWLVSSVCLFAATWFLAGCGKRLTVTEQGDRDQILHRAIGPEIGDIDPHLGTSSYDQFVLSALFEGLINEDPVDLHPVPGVAESWDVSPDGLTYTFHLRKNARWSNGDPVTAHDFVNSWRRVLTPSLTAPNATFLFVLQGAEAYFKGQNKDFAQVGAKAVDATTLRVTLEHPTPYFLSLLQHWTWWPVHLASIETVGNGYLRGVPWAKPGTFVGNGPFVLTERRVGQRTIVTKNPTYWDAATVRLKEIHFYPIEDAMAEERAFRAGQIHLTDAAPVSKIDAYRAEPNSPLRIDPYFATYFYRINVTRPFLNERKVREALARTVNRDVIVNKITRGDQLAASYFTPAGTAGYVPPTGYPFDPDAARALLAEAGYPGGKGAPVIEMLFNTSENHRVIAEAMQEMWRRELGLDVRLLNMENQTVNDARRAGSFQLLRSNWIGDYIDPSAFLDIFRSDNGNNYTGWANPTYDQLLYQASRTNDQAARLDLFKRAETLLLQEAPIIPIFTSTHVFLIRSTVKGWHPTLLDHHPYKHVWLEPAK